MNIEEARKLGYKIGSHKGVPVTIIRDKDGVENIMPLTSIDPNVHKPIVEMKVPTGKGTINGKEYGSGLSDQAKGMYERLRQRTWDKSASEAAANFEDAARAERVRDVKRMSIPEAALIGAGDELNSLYEGTKNIGDFGLYALSNAATLGMAPYDSALDRMVERKHETDIRNQTMQEFNDNTSGSQLSRMIPYMVTGRSLEPAARATVGRALGYTGEVVKDVAKKGGGLIRGAVRNAASNPVQKYNIPYLPSPVTNPLSAGRKRLASEIDEAIITPFENTVQTIAKRPKISDPFREGRLKEIGNSAAVGAAEGTMNINEDPFTGAGSSIMGTTMGLIYSPYLSKMPNKNSPEINAIINDAMLNDGYRATPGMRSGQPVLQSKEQGMRSNDKFSLYMKGIDEANDKVFAKKARQAMGMTETGEQGISPSRLNEHLDDLKSVYSDLESRSVGNIDKQQMKDFRSKYTGMVKKDQAIVDHYYDLISNLKHTQNRGAGGKFTGATFNGSDYQDLRSKLKTAKDTASAQNEFERSNALRDLIGILDNGMERGIKHHGDPELVSKWKKANEQYALTQLVIQNGMNPDGSINAQSLGNYLMNTDADRLLRGKGGEVKQLHDLAKITYVDRIQPGKGLDKESFTAPDTDKKSFDLLSTPAAAMMPIRTKMMADIYMSGKPSLSGLAGMSRDNNYWNASKLFRAAEQANDPHMDALSWISETGSSGLDWLDEKRKMLNQQRNNFVEKYSQ